MERQTYTNTNRYLFLFLIALMVSCSKKRRTDRQESKQGNRHLSGLQGCDHPCEHRPAQFLYRR